MDSGSVSGFIDGVDVNKDVQNRMRLPHLSDLIRTKLLIKYGGVWADPTCFCMKPLEEWIPASMDAGVFMFHRPGRDRVIANWFIAAEPGNPLLVKLYQELCSFWNDHHFRYLGRVEKSKPEYWLNRIINRNLNWPRIWFSPLMTRVLRLYPYMVYHYKVYDLVKTDRECAEIFRKMIKYPAQYPLMLASFGLLNQPSEEIRLWVDEKRSPIFKLNWKLESKAIPEGSLLQYLIDSEKGDNTPIEEKSDY